MSRDAAKPPFQIPPWARLGLRFLLSEEDRRVVFDELEDLYAVRCRSLGPTRARRSIRREVALYPVRLLGERLRVGGRTMLSLDLRTALRSFRRSPRFALTAVITLALGLGATTAILTVTKGTLLDPLPYPESDELVLVWSSLPASGYERGPISGPELFDLRRRSDSFDDFASLWTTTAALVGTGESGEGENDEPQTLRLALVTWNLPSLLGGEPILGRAFESGDEGPGATPAVVLSEGLWRQRFGADAGVIGRSLRLDGGWGFPGGIVTVVGVLPSSFRLILPADAGVTTEVDAWIPFPFPLEHDDRTQYYLRTLGRLKQGASFERGRDEVREIGAGLAGEFADYVETGRAFDLVPLQGDTVSAARPVLLALLAGVAVLLLVACTNVAGLLLARAAQRRDELALRTALGAGRTQIVGQLLGESLVLAGLGGAAGLLLGTGSLRLLLALAPPGLPRLQYLRLDGGIVLATFGLSLLCGVGFGLVPALSLRRGALASGLRSGNRSLPSEQRRRDALVLAEMALVFVLSVAALLCLRTVERLEQQDLGFDPGSVLTFELTLPRQRYGDETQLARLSEEIDRRLAAIPGAEAAGAVNQLPLSDLPNWSSPYRTRNVETADTEAHEADARVVTPGYLRTVGMRLVEGRLFDTRDDETSRLVVLVDRLLAERTWPGETALGRELEIQVRKAQGFTSVWAEVVGVVEHVRHHDPRVEVREQLWVPFAQGARNQMSVAVRGSGDPRALLGPVREEIAAIDPALAISRIRLLSDYVADAQSVQRFTLVLAASFAGMALLLGSIGLYGVVGYLVSQRRREIGLRLALGATTASVARLVLGRGLALVAGGAGLGLAGVVAARHLLSALLYGVSPTDPATLALIPLLLGVVALLACWLPARQAMAVDPSHVLREE